ncbi:MAG: tetratricopeptide repeat protein [Polyangiales bacterium]
MRRASLALALALGCAAAPAAALRERVGGAPRLRGFASPTAYEAYLRAEVATARGDHAQALRQLELAAVADPTDGYLTARRVEVLLAAGDVDAARETAAALTEASPELSAAWLALAEARARANDPAGAMDAARRALALDPDDPDVRAAAAEVAGGDAQAIAAARAGAPEAREGDRSLAARAMALDPAGIFRRSAAARRRALAAEPAERGAGARVDAALSPVVTLDARRVADRIRVIEARALDGRPADAAPLVAGLRVGDGADAVRPAEHARLWLLAGRADLAAEEAAAALAASSDDPLARRVLGHARLRLGDTAGAADALAGLAMDAPAGPLVELRRDPLSGAFEARAHVPGEAVAAPGGQWALARVAVAEALARAGEHALADRLLAAAVTSLTAPDARGARDRLRAARARALAARGAVAEGARRSRARRRPGGGTGARRSRPSPRRPARRSTTSARAPATPTKTRSPTPGWCSSAARTGPRASPATRPRPSPARSAARPTRPPRSAHAPRAVMTAARPARSCAAPPRSTPPHPGPRRSFERSAAPEIRLFRATVTGRLHPPAATECSI